MIGGTNMKQFAKGFVIGTAATVGAVLGGVFTFHKRVVKPIEEEETRFEENRKAAVRKGRSAHNK
ncbi:hypothetical protein FC26_GL000898 [Paucilactobacillus vaccinostercus DSM 20634]|jgi:hypothetical protein|uniref:DUF3042 domain-containing protein n=2 Tax=Paucilactobacillus vaccinostercus TaxID=176291 RepID=A0A0R2A981_9LACO|nr:hypothetical protein FC26_GL000898 [Paucilactobacillus vaccinostercus DSM 20634]